MADRTKEAIMSNPLKTDAEYLEDHRNWTAGVASAGATLAAYADQIDGLTSEIDALEESLSSLSDGTIEGAGAVKAAKTRLAQLEHALFGTELAHQALEEEIARLEDALAEIQPEVDRINGVPAKKTAPAVTVPKATG
jgi:chromosome segregation ATPase